MKPLGISTSKQTTTQILQKTVFLSERSLRSIKVVTANNYNSLYDIAQWCEKNLCQRIYQTKFVSLKGIRNVSA